MALPADHKNEDTIAAIATAMTQAGIGIIRISGSDAIPIADRLYRNAKKEKTLSYYKANTIHFGFIVDAEEHIVDEVMVSVMKHPHSYTTEDVVEINSHGGIYLLNRILQLVLQNGARMAEPGEFTKRAFLGGRIDLTKAEAVMDLIASENEFSRRNSINQLEGSLSKLIRNYRERILYEIAFIESALDDPENYDTTDYPNQLDGKLSALIKEMDDLLLDAKDSRLLKEGIRTVIVGKPNAGKSSLLNYLSHSDRAIVTDIAGTTRDTLEESVRLGDVVLHLVDTAGIRETEDAVEKIGVNRAVKAADTADLLLFLIDTSEELGDEDRIISDLVKEKSGEGIKSIVLLNKTDLRPQTTISQIKSLIGNDNIPMIEISLVEKTGLDILKSVIEELFHAGKLMERNEVYLTNIRHSNAIEAARDSCKLVRQSIADDMSEDFYSIDLMNAYASLGSIIGEQVDDDLVEEIFTKFCLGK